jgi:Protein of unknown function (DUF1493)
MEAFEEVKKFIQERWDLYPDQHLDRSTSLVRLGIEGEDAEEILSDFVKIYQIDAQGFKFEDYFPSEFALNSLIEKIRNKDEIKKKEFTLGDMERAILNRRLI